MENLKKIALSITFIMFLVSNAKASTLNVSVVGLDKLLPDTSWSYFIEFNITGDTAWFDPVNSITNDLTGSVNFDNTNQHIWDVLGNGSFFLPNWNQGAEVKNENILTILADDKGFGLQAPLTDGPLFSITYPDNVRLNLIFSSFLLSSDLELVAGLNPSGTSFGAGANNVTFSPVPIPGAIWMLGAGLMGLLGLKRKAGK